MSERGSFVTQYFYNDNDYEIIRKALDKGDKYLCISPPAEWDNNKMPIVSGKVGALALNCEWLTIDEAIYGVKTENEVRIVVMCDGGSIVLVTKSPEGCTDCIKLKEET